MLGGWRYHAHHVPAVESEDFLVGFLAGDQLFGSAVKVMLAPVFFDINRLRFVVLGEPQSPSSASLVVALR